MISKAFAPCNLSHFTRQFQPFYAVISVFLHGNISHFAMLSQSYWFAYAVLPSPTNVACDTRDMFFGFVCMQRYKILQAIARLSLIFFMTHTARTVF